MTRRRVFAVAILLAAVAVTVANHQRVWWLVAYSKTELPGTSFVILHKRVSWLPGENEVIHTQLCHCCEQGHHLSCLEPMAGMTRTFLTENWDEHYTLHLPLDFRCTCRNPSHQSRGHGVEE